MQRFLLLASLVSAWFTALGQTQSINQTTKDWISLSGDPVPMTSGVISSFNHYNKQLLGTSYEDSTFQAGNIRFYGKVPGTRLDSLLGVPMRHDLLTQQLEILAGPNNIRVAQAPQVRQFTINNRKLQAASYYVNVREFRGEADVLLGFFEVLTTGRATLLRYPSAIIRKSDYNVALSVGNKDDALELKQVWYVAKGPKAVVFSPSKRAILSLFADKEADMTTYLKTQKPDLKSRAGLTALVAYYNSLE
ncbi:hypothetical protein FAES_1748 [Fibrella aestuarina BUZ 2]|uniref:Uncharacterized protein n=1 Tax=Fibrella aestuarina BUZ 2 TaxID=1166018 RepID=I0K6K5_9BACT|nr:hypothetical protein [Fibrella aestuarina]CCG99758.1 hypothetical protein FAES_1748 [Fibrella aestuarina BUZ 2]